MLPARPSPAHAAVLIVRVRVEIMGSQTCRIAGKSQSVLIMINPMIFTRTRTYWAVSCERHCW
eukprot:COSAG01_NODE_1196_length_11303_cov_16.500714_14_plen_63_part_00